MDQVPEGLRTALNEIRETLIQDNKLYAQNLPTILPDTPIGSLSQPLFADEDFFKNDFMPVLIKRIVATSVFRRFYRNPLESLKDGEMPLGGISQDIFVNRVKSRQFNVNDFAGLLAKYPTDVKVIYNALNWDHQYMATISYDNIRDAFVSWSSLYNLTDEIAQAMYNEASIDDFNMTKYLISNAYRNNQVVMREVEAPTDETTAKTLVKTLRSLFAGFRFASTQFNGWNLNGGYGLPVRTWTMPEDVVVFIRATDMAEIDVDVLAAAFNMNKTDLMGRIYEVDNFDIIDLETGATTFDGSNIIAAIGDRRWFDIKQQMRRFNQFFNANNETWQLYLHVKEGFNSRAFANMVLLVSETPNVPVTALAYNPEAVTMDAGGSTTVNLNVTPASATTEITFAVTKAGAASEDITVTPSNNNRTATLTATDGADGEYVLTATAGDVTKTLTVTVAPAQANAVSAQDLSKQINAAVKKEVAKAVEATTANQPSESENK